jgi:hypothetical protein
VIRGEQLPSQTSDLKIGLPTITLGAGQTATQKQFIFLGNLTDNSAAVSIEIDPIESRDFNNGILTPISVATIGILLANFPKEMVYLALLDSVRFEQAGGYTIEYKNDPRPPSTKCQSENYTTYDPAYPGQLMLSRYFPPGEGDYADLTNCPYQRFVDWVETAIAYGLSVATKDVPNPKYDPSDTKGTQPKTIKVGRFCLDPAQARPGVFDQLKGLPTALCDEPPKGTEENKPPLMFPFTRGSKQVLATLEFWPRSLVSLFTYLGKILKSEPNDLVVLYNQTAQANDDRAL